MSADVASFRHREIILMGLLRERGRWNKIHGYSELIGISFDYYFSCVLMQIVVVQILYRWNMSSFRYIVYMSRLFIFESEK
jgi:hypothetical protein